MDDDVCKELLLKAADHRCIQWRSSASSFDELIDYILAHLDHPLSLCELDSRGHYSKRAPGRLAERRPPGAALQATLWDRWSQRLEITSGELLPDQAVPLLKRRWELTRDEALRLWSEKRKEGWQSTTPQWQPPPAQAQE